MSHGTLVFLIGFLLLIVPALGIPAWWKDVLLISFGVVLLMLGYRLRRRQYLSTLTSDGQTRTSETFVETTTPLFPAAD